MRKKSLLLVMFAGLPACREATRTTAVPARSGGTNQTRSLAGTTITFSVSLAQEETAALQGLISQLEGRTGADVTITNINSSDLPANLCVDVGAGRPTVKLFAQDNLALAVLVQENLVEDLSDVRGALRRAPPQSPPGTAPRRYRPRRAA